MSASQGELGGEGVLSEGGERQGLSLPPTELLLLRSQNTAHQPVSPPRRAHHPAPHRSIPCCSAHHKCRVTTQHPPNMAQPRTDSRGGLDAGEQLRGVNLKRREMLAGLSLPWTPRNPRAERGCFLWRSGLTLTMRLCPLWGQWAGTHTAVGKGLQRGWWFLSLGEAHKNLIKTLGAFPRRNLRNITTLCYGICRSCLLSFRGL